MKKIRKSLESKCILMAILFGLCAVFTQPATAWFVQEFDIPEEEPQVTTQPSQTAPSYSKSAQAGDTWTEPVTGMEFVWVSKGCFQMGSNNGDSDEKPVRQVCLDGFWMAKYEVTQDQWQGIMGKNPSKFKGAQRPVEMVSWHDAKAFIQKLSRKSGKTFALPTEAQWEYAARSGGKNETYSGGNAVDRVAWYRDNSGRQPHDVGTKAPNGFGIYDMSGNVWEWCEDVYDTNAYSRHSSNNPLITSGSKYRVLRGGSWLNSPGYVRSADRYWYAPSRRFSFIGFRLASP